MSCDDITLAELIEGMTTAERVLLATAFDAMTDFRHARGVAAWAEWWAWKAHVFLGDRPERPQPLGMPPSTIPLNEQAELRGAMLQIATDHPHRPRLVGFAIKLLAQLVALDVERQDQRVDLVQHISEQRRERPYGSLAVSHDHRGLPRWSEISGAPDSE